MADRKKLVSVIGGHACAPDVAKIAERVGKVIAEEGAVLICGGLGGVMEAASRGSKKAGGITIGIMPGENKEDANPFIDIPITTGMGYSRNTLVVGAADIVIAFAGKYGTLSEIGFALNAKKKVYGFGTWDIEGVVPLKDPEDVRGILK